MLGERHLSLISQCSKYHFDFGVGGLFAVLGWRKNGCFRAILAGIFRENGEYYRRVVETLQECHPFSMTSGKESEELFDFIIAYMAVAVITAISRSYREDFILSLLVLIPIVLIKIIYTRTKYKKMGKPLVKLRKTSSDLPGIRSTLIIFLLFAIFIVSVSYFSKNHRIGFPWLILFSLQILYGRFTEIFIQKGLMDNGICTGRRLIEWDTVQSYKWTIPKKKKDFTVLKIEYSKFYSFHIAFLWVLDEQKEEVDGLLKKMVRV